MEAPLTGEACIPLSMLMGVGLPRVVGASRPSAEDFDIDDSEEALMSKATMDAMQARLDVLSLALVALARAVPTERVAAVQDALRRDLEQRLDGVALSPEADEAMAAEVSNLISALNGRLCGESERAELRG